MCINQNHDKKVLICSCPAKPIWLSSVENKRCQKEWQPQSVTFKSICVKRQNIRFEWTIPLRYPFDCLWDKVMVQFPIVCSKILCNICDLRKHFWIGKTGSVLFRNHLLLEHSINHNQARAQHFQNAQIVRFIIKRSLLTI